MARKKKEQELTNIDLIVKKLKTEMKELKSTVKLDGITIECETKPKTDMKALYDNIRNFCTKNNLNPISFETNKERENTFIVQLPEYESKFTDDEKEKLFKNNFKFLVDSLYRNDHDNKVTEDVVRKSRDMAIQQCLSIYFRSYANQYKVRIEDWLNDQELKYKMQVLYQDFVNDYYLNRNLKEE